MIVFLAVFGLVQSALDPLPPNHMWSIALLGKNEAAPRAESFGEPEWCNNYNPLALDPRYEPFLLNSGKSADDFGMWEDCRDL